MVARAMALKRWWRRRVCRSTAQPGQSEQHYDREKDRTAQRAVEGMLRQVVGVGGQRSDACAAIITSHAESVLPHGQPEAHVSGMVQTADKSIEQDAGEKHPYDLRTLVFDDGHVSTLHRARHNGAALNRRSPLNG